MYADQLIENVPTSHAISGLAAAKAACIQLREKGAVVLNVSVGPGRPVIFIERPSRPLKKTGEVIRITRDDSGRRTVREYEFVGCTVRWSE
jgi:hypothetical protein